jgi:hypothetical protein
VRDAKTVSIDAQNGPTSFSTEYLPSVFVWCILSYCYFPWCTHNVTSFAINSLCIHSLSKHIIANSCILLYRGWNALAWVSCILVHVLPLGSNTGFCINSFNIWGYHTALGSFERMRTQVTSSFYIFISSLCTHWKVEMYILYPVRILWTHQQYKPLGLDPIKQTVLTVSSNVIQTYQ